MPPDETRVAKVEPRIRSSLFKNSFFLLYSALVFFFCQNVAGFLPLVQFYLYRFMGRQVYL